MTRQDWYVATDRGDVGPYTALELRELAQTGRIAAHTPVRRGDMQQPVRADKVRGLVPRRRARDAAPAGTGPEAAVEQGALSVVDAAPTPAPHAQAARAGAAAPTGVRDATAAAGGDASDRAKAKRGAWITRSEPTSRDPDRALTFEQSAAAHARAMADLARRDPHGDEPGAPGPRDVEVPAGRARPVSSDGEPEPAPRPTPKDLSIDGDVPERPLRVEPVQTHERAAAPAQPRRRSSRAESERRSDGSRGSGGGAGGRGRSAGSKRESRGATVRGKRTRRPERPGQVLSVAGSRALRAFVPAGATAHASTAALLVSCVMQIVLIGRESAWRHGATAALSGDPAALDSLTEVNKAVLVATVIMVGSLLGVLVAFLLWLQRSYENLSALDAPPLRSTPAWAVGCFFVPLVNFFKPYQVVQEVLRVSTRSRVPAIAKDRVAIPGTQRVMVWWATWLLALVVLPLAGMVGSGRVDVSPGAIVAAVEQAPSGAAASDMAVMRSELRRRWVFDLSEALARTVAALATVVVVVTISRRQAGAAQALGASRPV